MNNIKISMITVTYNSEKTLERTIQSVINQSYDNVEYIIVDGGSTDGTIDIIKKYESSIAKWVSEKDDGISDAFNKGIRMATGDIIGIINSDDGLEPDALLHIVENYDPNVDVYRGNVVLWNEATNMKTVEEPSLEITFSGFFKVCHQGTFVTKEAYEKYGVYDTNCTYMMDYDLLLRYGHAGAVFKKIDASLAFYTLAGLTTTAYNEKRQQELEYVLRKNGASKAQIFKKNSVAKLKRVIRKVIGKDFSIKLRHSIFKHLK